MHRKKIGMEQNRDVNNDKNRNETVLDKKDNDVYLNLSLALFGTIGGLIFFGNNLNLLKILITKDFFREEKF